MECITCHKEYVCGGVRGNCVTCYRMHRKKVKLGVTTWEKLERQKKTLPSKAYEPAEYGDGYK